MKKYLAGKVLKMSNYKCCLYGSARAILVRRSRAFAACIHTVWMYIKTQTQLQIFSLAGYKNMGVLKRCLSLCVPKYHELTIVVSLSGPTDLSMKKNSSKNQLSASEVATIKQLISGYRESAAFLYRSADELEQLLLQQN